MSSFTSPLLVEIEQGEVDGRGTAKLIAGFGYDVGALGSSDKVDVPPGFSTDFASIPRFARPLFSNFDRSAKAAVIHDFLFNQKPRARSRSQIDAIFYEAMGVLAVADWRRWIMWAAVRLQAWAKGTTVHIDLSPIVNGVIVPLLVPILSAALLWLVYKVAALFHIQIQNNQRALLETAISNGITFAQNKVATLPETVTVGNPIIGQAAAYVTKTAPGALAALGLNKDADALAAAITARLPS